MEQVMIGITGVLAILFTQLKNEKLNKYAPLLGLASQPFWFYTSWVHEQWGIFFLSFFYTYAWVVGVKNKWVGR